MPETKKFLIIDANAIIHRAYHGLPPLKTKRGEIVNAVYGFCLMFLKALNEIKPDYIAACFDVKGPTFRHKQFKDYKAKRVKAPDELYSQIGLVKDVLGAFSVPVFEKPGYEADDLIATICFLAQKKQPISPEIIILSGDMDNLQLVSENVRVYTMRRGLKDTVLYGIKEVGERYDGLSPEQVVDYKALRGDSSDNIPGITGIGEKTAIQILLAFGTLENLYQEVEAKSKKSQTIKPALLQKIQQNKEQAFLSQKLAQMDNKVPIDFNLKECEFGGYEKEKVKLLFQKLEFFSLFDKFFSLTAKNQKTAKTKNSREGLFGDSLQTDEGADKEIENLEKSGALSPNLAKLELALVPLVKKMEENGILVDFKKLKQLSSDFEKKIEKLQSRVFKISGQEFNLNSPSQLSEILFKKMSISTLGIKKTPGGAISTNAEELKKLANEHPIINLIREYRKIFKLKTGFVDALPRVISPKDGRIHPHFHQLGTETGRMSCSEPNLQNIPVKTDLGRKIRECFVSENGFIFLSADYSQMDFRVAASLSGDEKMLGFLSQGKDIHLMTASLLFRIQESDVSPSQRALAKTLNYGVLYGLGPFGFAGRTGLAFKDAKRFIAQYFETFQGIAEFVRKTIEETKEKEFSQTMFGRKRFLPEINSRDPRLRAQAERIARNFPVQGCLPQETKVLTSAGYKPIGELYTLKKKPDFIWNGSNWAKYSVLDRGKAQLAEIIFSNGQIFRCDTRHEVLVAQEEGYFWKNFCDLRPGARVCFSVPFLQELKNPSPVKFTHKLNVHNAIPFSIKKLPQDFWYWMGYYYGDGHFSKRWNRGWCYYLEYYFGFQEEEKATQCIKFFSSLGLNPKKRSLTHKTKKGIYSTRKVIRVHSKGLGKFLEYLGIEANQKAATKRLSGVVFGETLENRRDFVQGLMDSDGYYGEKDSEYVPNIHICQRVLLQDIQLLLRTLGVESTIRGPYRYVSGLTSFRLDIPRRALFSLLNKPASQFSRYGGRPTPKFLIQELISLYPNLKRGTVRTYSDHVLYRRWKRGGTSSIFHFIEWLKRNNLKIKSPLYIWHEVKEIHRLKKKETTYTLNVKDESHKFDSEGVISKNTAADIMKMAMARISEKKILNKNCRLLLQLHDELLFEIKEDEIEKPKIAIKQIMEQAAKIEAPLKAEVKTGQNWGEV